MPMKFVSAVALCCAALMMPGQASALCVKVPEANLRQGPGTEFEKSWTVYKYMPFKKIGKQDGWYKVEDVDGDQHWIFGKLVSDKIRCAVVNTDDVNVRTGPGTRYGKSPISPVEHYYSFKVLKVQGKWVKVEDEVSNKGWVSRPLLWIP